MAVYAPAVNEIIVYNYTHIEIFNIPLADLELVPDFISGFNKTVRKIWIYLIARDIKRKLLMPVPDSS